MDGLVVYMVGLMAVAGGSVIFGFYWGKRGREVVLAEEGDFRREREIVYRQEEWTEKEQRELEKRENPRQKNQIKENQMRREEFLENRNTEQRTIERRKKEERNLERNENYRGGRNSKEKQKLNVSYGWAVGSPVAGKVRFFCEEKRKGVAISPKEGRLYAPVSGKIIKLYPTGNAFRIRTDFGAELLIRAGVHTEELEGLYYRCRVVQNEIVSKGKLLLEYDIESISKEGYDSSVLLSVEEEQNYRDITVTDAEQVKNGDPVLWVC